MKRLKAATAWFCAFWLAALAAASAELPPGPILQATLQTNGIVLSWPNAVGDFLLMTTDRLGQEATWWPARR